MVAALTAASAGCALNVRSGDVSDGSAPFSGTWSVEWCNEARPDQECGGFDVTLVQKGGRICGKYDSARVNLTQDTAQTCRFAATATTPWWRSVCGA